MICDSRYNTTLAFVHLGESGERDFSFYRKGYADIMFTAEEAEKAPLDNCRFFTFGGVSMSDEPSRTATFDTAIAAKKAGATVCFDPNHRPLLWDNSKDAAECYRRGVSISDIIKVSDEEMELITGKKDIEKGSDRLLEFGAKVIFVTLGAEGAYYRTKNFFGKVAGFKVEPVNTTGAGDSFFGAVLWQLSLLTNDISDICQNDREKIIRFANATGTLTAMDKGAISSLPDLKSVNGIIG